MIINNVLTSDNIKRPSQEFAAHIEILEKIFSENIETLKYLKDIRKSFTDKCIFELKKHIYYTNINCDCQLEKKISLLYSTIRIHHYCKTISNTYKTTNSIRKLNIIYN